jgi:hypothetical protein
MRKTTSSRRDGRKPAGESAQAAAITVRVSVLNAALRPRPRLLLFCSGQGDLAQSVDEALAGFGES